MSVRSSGRHVWLASYPKSGNTWLRIALTSLCNGGTPVDLMRMESGIGKLIAFRRWLDETLDVDSSDLSAEEIQLLRPKMYSQLNPGGNTPTVWKVHDSWDRTSDGDALFPAEVTAATVYIVRDPRDVAVSFSHHFGVDIPEVIRLMADSSYRVAAKTGSGTLHVPQVYSSWSDHVASWIDRSGLDPLIIKYEDMVVDLAGALRRVSDALGWRSDILAIEGAVAATRFESLQEQEAATGFIETPANRRPFFRRGVAGGWRGVLSATQAARIEQDHRVMMERLGYR